MSVSKNRDISLHRSNEKQALRRFLGLYIFLVVALLSLLSTFYYQSQEKLMFSNQRTILSTYANEQVKKLKILHHYFPAKTEYPRSIHFKSAIYDIERVFIFSTLENENINFDKEVYRVGKKIHFVKLLDDYYLGAHYLFTEIDEDRAWVKETILNIIAFGTVALFILGIFGLFFVNLFLRPMKNSIALLDNFIKDTTHELNTPISAILANIEMMDKSVMSEKNIKKLSRINVAAKTVSHLYQDLTYLVLGHQRSVRDEWIDLEALVIDRVEYFSLLAEAKQINFILDLEPREIWIDGAKIARVVDNLISNAIKYNKRGGEIVFRLREDCFMISDTGIGIEKEKISAMFERYSRFNSSEGGFGIGLNIVKSILDEYSLEVEVNSVIKMGTTIKVHLPKRKKND
ncbi:MAG TPA: HAMP domain-containing histidine kinase [Campylobacterales bacterium]|nr:HAMP domain-containing histidine kinase [Campylobacterales bacterium]